MKCPRCNHEWDVRQSPCPRCHLYIRTPSLQGSTNGQAPMRASPFNSSPIADFVGDSVLQVRSNHPRGPINDKLVQPPFPVPLNPPQFSRYPLPSTGELSPKRTIFPLSDQVHTLSVQQASPTLRLSSSKVPAEMQPLLPGTLLHRDRYKLHENLQQQAWPLGIFETVWEAVDTRIAKSLVVIRELNIPPDVPNEAHVIPYAATKVLTSIGRNSHILSLRDVFRDKGRSFFVFEPIDGLSVLALMFNSGGKLPEKEVVICCLQVVELLHICVQQSPPFIHGNIRPEAIVRKSTDSEYVLTNFSVALAGGLAQIVADMGNPSNVTDATKMLMREKMDVRTDLSALLRMAYYAVTGQWSSGAGASAPLMGAADSELSPQLHALLLKGLWTPFNRGYQSPAELYQDLFALYSSYEGGSPSQQSVMSEEITSPSIPVVQGVKSEPADLIVPVQSMEQTLLVPLPDELPPLKEAHDMRNAALWFFCMLFCLVILLGHSLT
jgi:serine/threonine protein kinase